MTCTNGYINGAGQPKLRCSNDSKKKFYPFLKLVKKIVN
jgi:hypothetical protein